MDPGGGDVAIDKSAAETSDAPVASSFIVVVVIIVVVVGSSSPSRASMAILASTPSFLHPA